MQQSISAIILTYNEEKHIARCIHNIKNVADHIYVIDSFSTDNTCEIASKLGVTVIQHQFVNQAQQLQWALDTIEIEGDWILRVDADEYLSNQLICEINETIPNLSKEITGCDMPRDVVFMGKHLKWGKIKSIRLLRMWRKGAAYVEQRWMDEHCVLKYGECHHLKSLFFDDNINGLTEWINKHNKYTNREVVVMLSSKYMFGVLNVQMKRRNSLKNLYYSLPLYLRPTLYFISRYVLLLGFLDGIPGLVWHTLQAYWYRFLIDSKIHEMYRIIGKNPTKESIISYVKDAYNIDIE